VRVDITGETTLFATAVLCSSAVIMGVATYLFGEGYPSPMFHIGEGSFTNPNHRKTDPSPINPLVYHQFSSPRNEKEKSVKGKKETSFGA